MFCDVGLNNFLSENLIDPTVLMASQSGQKLGI